MSSLKEFLFKDYPPAVTAMFCTTAFAVYLLINAGYYEFSSAPDHSMPSDYNRFVGGLMLSFKLNDNRVWYLKHLFFDFDLF